MGCPIAQTATIVMRKGKHLLTQRIPNDGHEALTGFGAAGPRLWDAIFAIVAVLVLLVLLMPQPF